MSGMELNNAMARLYTDDIARQELYGGDTRGFSGYGLSSQELESLASFASANKKALELYVGILGNKRADKVCPLLPVLWKALDGVEAEGWKRAWREFRRSNLPGPLSTPAEEATSFVSYMESQGDSLGPSDGPIREAVRYERTKLELKAHYALAGSEVPVLPEREGRPLLAHPFAIESFAHDPLGAGAPPRPIDSVSTSPTLVLFCRHQTSGSIITARISGQLARLLRGCNGERTADDLVVMLAENGQPHSSTAAVQEILDMLLASGVITVLRTRDGRK